MHPTFRTDILSLFPGIEEKIVFNTRTPSRTATAEQHGLKKHFEWYRKRFMVVLNDCRLYSLYTYQTWFSKFLSKCFMILSVNVYMHFTLLKPYSMHHLHHIARGLRAMGNRLRYLEQTQLLHLYLVSRHSILETWPLRWRIPGSIESSTFCPYLLTKHANSSILSQTFR